jgi:hypothetical protein
MWIRETTCLRNEQVQFSVAAQLFTRLDSTRFCWHVRTLTLPSLLQTLLQLSVGLFTSFNITSAVGSVSQSVFWSCSVLKKLHSATRGGYFLYFIGHSANRFKTLLHISHLPHFQYTPTCTVRQHWWGVRKHTNVKKTVLHSFLILHPSLLVNKLSQSL